MTTSQSRSNLNCRLRSKSAWRVVVQSAAGKISDHGSRIVKAWPKGPVNNRQFHPRG